ncbi:MAG: hypothetical protein IT378_22420 [Sandaracinaceae bacterium]|nr:hypothetical protein [Sandaracinaceae bacterium]
MSACKGVVASPPPRVCGAQRYRCNHCGAVGCATDPRCPNHNFDTTRRDVKCKKCGHVGRREV